MLSLQKPHWDVVHLSLAIVSRGRSRMTKILRGFQQVLPTLSRPLNLVFTRAIYSTVDDLGQFACMFINNEKPEPVPESVHRPVSIRACAEPWNSPFKYTKFKIIVLWFMWVSASKTARKTNDLNYIPFNLVVSHGMWVHDRLYLKTREFKFWIAPIQINKLKPPPPGGVLPYMGYIGMRGPKRYSFSAVLVINRVSNLADSGHK